MRKQFDIQVAQDMFRKWDILRGYGKGTGVVIKKFKEAGNTTLMLYPYNVPKNKYLRFLKFQWLKLRVWLKIIR